MGLKRRLVAAFAIIIMVPVLLAGAVTVAVLGYHYQALANGLVEGENGETLYYVVNEKETMPQLQVPIRQTIIIKAQETVRNDI